MMGDSDSSSSDPDAPPPPPSSVCQERIDQFLQVIHNSRDEAYAQMLLQRSGWQVEAAVAKHFQREAKALGMDVKISQRAPERIHVATWNVDGLDDRDRVARTEQVCKIIQDRKIEIVFLQEVVNETLPIFKDRLSTYQVLAQNEGQGGGYFTAVLIKRLCVYLDSFTTVDFPSSRMGRGVQIVECHVGKAKLTLINTHLESTKEGAEERKNQTRTCFNDHLAKVDPGRSVIFGGDLNARDAEVDEIGVPANVEDLWNLDGARKECKFTWDMTRNTNLEFPGRFKPRCRFDRLYLRDSDPKRLILLHFGLIGLEKVPGMQRFPSDHWGIEAAFRVNSN